MCSKQTRSEWMQTWVVLLAAHEVRGERQYVCKTCAQMLAHAGTCSWLVVQDMQAWR